MSFSHSESRGAELLAVPCPRGGDTVVIVWLNPHTGELEGLCLAAASFSRNQVHLRNNPSESVYCGNCPFKNGERHQL